MKYYILRKEKSGYYLYDVDTDVIFYAELNITNFYDSKCYKSLSREKKLLPSDYFSTHDGRFIDNSKYNNDFSAPETVFLELTKRCNLRCGHCFNNSGSIDFDSELELLVIKRLIAEFENSGVFNVKLTGGEPFCRKDIFDIMSYLDDKHINYTIFSNGTNISDVDIGKLKNLKNLLKIRISVDGTEETNDAIRGVGTFKKAINTVKRLVKNNIPCEINYTITKQNYMQISDLTKYLEKHDINCRINIGMVKIAGRAKSASEEYYFTENNLDAAIQNIKEQIHENMYVKPFYILEPIYYHIFGNSFGCPAARLTTTVKCSGDVYPCGLLSSFEEFMCGNIQNESFQNIWNGKKMNVLRTLTTNEMCSKCKYYTKTCTGACRGNAINYFGNICSSDINCHVYQVNFNE